MERLSQCDMRAVPLSHRAVPTDCAVLFVAEVCKGRVVELSKRVEGRKCRGHDGVGNLTKITDALGMSTVSKYDANGNLISNTDRNGNETTYAYDAENRLIRTMDAEGNTTVYTYDALGRMTVTVSAMGSETVST